MSQEDHSYKVITMAKTEPKVPPEMGGLGGYTSAITVIIVGFIVTLILFFFFAGFGFWALPGMLIIFAGIAVGLNTLLSASVPNPNSTLKSGLMVLFLGLGAFLSFMPHVLLGTFQIMTLALTIIGVIVTVSGLYKGYKGT